MGKARDVAQRFWEKVDPSGPVHPTLGPCWQWTGALSDGHAFIWVGHKSEYAHRVLFEWRHGPVPDGLELDHLCRNRGCVRPGHLEPVTHRVNSLRGMGPTASNARKTHCARAGHPLIEGNIYRPPSKPNGRECLACKKDNKRRAKS